VAEVVRAELVGQVLQLFADTGHAVGPGQPLVLLESMKMEIPVTCETGGVVTEVGVAVGDVVHAGDVLVVLR